MSNQKTRGLRGSALEELINMTNEQYLEQDLALIQKVPTPITPLNIDKESRHITLAYFDHKVQWIISALCRAYRCALTRKNAAMIPSVFRMFTRIRSGL